MALTFYPHSDAVQRGSFEERIETFMEAAQNYKAVILEMTTQSEAAGACLRMIPREQAAAYNWGEIAHLFHELRDLPEASKDDKIKKAALLAKLAEIYEVLRAAKMPKLEAVRLALINEANQLRGGAQVA
ncbi:MAG TPA: hypothetical protein VJN02_01600 [Gammaproteobacteria bacterium]|nr:hypothetical protein [Gammaproteobacteria bacterium]